MYVLKSTEVKLSEYEKSIESFCISSPCSLALPESSEERIFKAALYLVESRAVKKIYFFQNQIEFNRDWAKFAKNFDSCLKSKFILVPEEMPSLKEEVKEFIQKKYQIKQKKISNEDLNLFASKALYQAGYLLQNKKVDLVVAGVATTTAEVIKAALSTVGLVDSLKTLSGSFLMLKDIEEKEVKAYIYADCGVVIEPDENQLVDIAIESVKTWNGLMGDKIPAKVAFLSFSTNGSADHKLSQKMKKACELFHQKYPSILAEGEIQADAAIVPEVSRLKSPNSEISGEANILIFPGLNAGNIAYKLTERLGGFKAYGPFLQGLRYPYSDLSRGASIKDIAVSVYLNHKKYY